MTETGYRPAHSATPPRPGSAGSALLAAALVLASAPAAPARAEWATPFELSATHAEDHFTEIRFLGALALPFAEIDGYPFVEISGLAFDADENLLYALSDLGRVFHLRLAFSDGRLAGVEPLAGFALRDEKGDPLSGKSADSEGLTLENQHNAVPGDTRLIVSFERKPKLLAYSATGRLQRSYELPSALAHGKQYRSKNKSLEAVTRHPTLGLLVAPEWPLRKQREDRIPIVDLSGRSWWFPRYPASKTGLVAMEALDDGTLLTLERSFVSVFSPVLVILRRSSPLTQDNAETWLETTELAVLSSFQGWRVDNFEGLTRHRGMRFLIVSDDNQFAFQKTLLVYFELRPHGNREK